MTSDDIVEILNDKVKEFDDEFEVRNKYGSLSLRGGENNPLASFPFFEPRKFYLGTALEDELEWEITDGSVKLEKYMEVTKLFYAEAKPLLEEYCDE